jgi:hypothetical protein
VQAFGLSKTMLAGAGSGETYAADALNRDLVTQLLTDTPALHQELLPDRMLVVAEAQEHYDYDVRNGKRYVKMEESWRSTRRPASSASSSSPSCWCPS